MAKELRLSNIPEDVRRILLKKQFEIKEHIGHNRFSIECTIYKIVREWKELKKKHNEG